MTPFVRPREVGAPVVRLIVFHHAGGSAGGYYPLTRDIPPEWDLLLLDLPGRGKRHTVPPLSDMASIITAATEDVLPWTGDVPVALFGHSLGAVVALEVARALQGLRVPPVWVGVSGRVPPHLRPGISRIDHDLADDDLLRGLTVMGGLPPRLDELPDFRHRFLGLVRADLRALGSYRPDPWRRPLSMPVTAFGGVADDLAPPPTLAQWAGETTGGLRVRLFDGGHFYFLGSNFPELATTITEEIEHSMSFERAGASG